MLMWIMNNIGTIIITLILASIVVAVIKKIISDRRNGKSSCGCNCSSCAMSEACHGNK